MLNISKYQKVFVGCSAIVALALTGYAQSANAEANQSNGTGTNTSNSTGTNASNTTGTNASNGTGSRFSPSAISRAGALNSRISLAQGAYDTAAQNLAAAEAATPTASDTTPVRFARQSLDAASCGCPNADTNPTATAAPRAELVAARAAEAQAAAELAAAKAEARQFLESVKSETTASSSTSSVLW